MKADDIKTAAELPPRQGGVQAFTLVEIMIVVFIIGLLAAIAIPSFLKARTESRTVMCIENMRVIFQASHMYEMDTGDLLDVKRGELRDTLWDNGNGYVPRRETFECPCSGTPDYDDYILVYDDTTLTGITCQMSSSYPDHVY